MAELLYRLQPKISAQMFNREFCSIRLYSFAMAFSSFVCLWCVVGLGITHPCEYGPPHKFHSQYEGERKNLCNCARARAHIRH